MKAQTSLISILVKCRLIYIDPLGTQNQHLSTNSGAAKHIRFAEYQENNVLNVTVLDLQPDWGITQIYPSGPAEWFIPLDPGQEVLLPLNASLPEGYAEGRDTIKVFATLGESTTNFQWLQLPSLDQPAKRSVATRGERPADPLEAMMQAITADRPMTRNLEPTRYPSKVWTTAQAELTIRR